VVPISFWVVAVVVPVAWVFAHMLVMVYKQIAFGIKMVETEVVERVVDKKLSFFYEHN
jgi:hypothetical protein